jgi:hypothetical protein
MALVKPNLEEEAREPIPAGIYVVRVLGSEMKTSQKGNDYLNWKLSIDQPKTRFHGRWVFLSTTLSGKGAQKLRDLVRATCNPDYNGGEFDTDDVKGFPFQVRLSPGLKQDGSESDFPNVDEILPLQSIEADVPY